MKSKRFIRNVACLLACVVALSVFAQPVSAKPADQVNTDLILAAEKAENSYSVSIVRNGASYRASKVGSFKNGTKLTVLQESGEFYKVDCFDMTGYIAKSQVSVNENGEYYVNCVKGSTETENIPFYSMQAALELRHDILEEARKYIGVRYVSGGTSPRGFDCSGYTQFVLNKLNVTVDRTVWDQMADGVIVAKEDLQPGDLVIFSYTGTYGGFASHVGIYIGNDKIIHASSGYGITISDLNSEYYARHYQCARRIIMEEESFTLSIPATGIMHSASGSYWRGESTTDSIFVGI